MSLLQCEWCPIRTYRSLLSVLFIRLTTNHLITNRHITVNTNVCNLITKVYPLLYIDSFYLIILITKQLLSQKRQNWFIWVYLTFYIKQITNRLNIPCHIFIKRSDTIFKRRHIMRIWYDLFAMWCERDRQFFLHFPVHHTYSFDLIPIILTNPTDCQFTELYQLIQNNMFSAIIT